MREREREKERCNAVAPKKLRSSATNRWRKALSFICSVGCRGHIEWARSWGIVAPGAAWLFSASSFIQLKRARFASMAEVQLETAITARLYVLLSLALSLLRCNEQRRTPIISFLLYCLFNSRRLQAFPTSPHSLFSFTSIATSLSRLSALYPVIFFDRNLPACLAANTKLLPNSNPSYVPWCSHIAFITGTNHGRSWLWITCFRTVFRSIAIHRRGDIFL